MAMKKLTTNQWIEKARKKHGDRYDYSQVDYKNNKINVTIICKEHGPFEQAPKNHLSGYNCRKCKKPHNNKKLTTEQWIEKARKKHGDRYDYSQVDYKNSHSILTIICAKHGSFKQIAYSHLAGAGCPICSGNAPMRSHILVKKISWGGRVLEHIDLSDDEFMSLNSKKSRTIGVFCN